MTDTQYIHKRLATLDKETEVIRGYFVDVRKPLAFPTLLQLSETNGSYSLPRGTRRELYSEQRCRTKISF
jgi:hypothetical protein